MSKSKIEWTERTWNPVTGCTKVSAGCANCYAERMARRIQAMGEPMYRDGFAVRCHQDRLEIPLQIKKPSMFFVNSMGDLFHEDVPFEFIDRVFAVMALCPQHTFQVLTKRPERMADYTNDHFTVGRISKILLADRKPIEVFNSWPLPNVFLGTSCENQIAADKRIPYLLRCPAAVRFVSCEPLLGPIALGLLKPISEMSPAALESGASAESIGIDWVIVGGESGPRARPMHPDWARSIRDECKAAGVPFFFKQWGEWAPNCLCGGPKGCTEIKRPEPGKWGVMFRCGKKAAGDLLDGVQWHQMPKAEK